ncbi:hypothetical protein E4T56_gene12130 [Termitomyces sp. T112]|nr:hypothetical protein E4T56_gene12130 [Termitomyces sp. T112]
MSEVLGVNLKRKRKAKENPPADKTIERFIQDFSHHAHPLFDLTGKDAAWQWEPPQQAAFNALKQAVTSKPILLFPDDDSPFCVEADGSDSAMGAILSQQSKEDGKWHPVAFYSKSLNAVEWNYKIHDKEMLGTSCIAPVYKPGDHVYLDSSDIKTTRPSQKLLHCHLGPFMVEKKVGPLAY